MAEAREREVRPGAGEWGRQVRHVTRTMGVNPLKGLRGYQDQFLWIAPKKTAEMLQTKQNNLHTKDGILNNIHYWEITVGRGGRESNFLLLFLPPN